MSKFYPDMYQKSIYSINYKKLKEDGIKCLLFDLDNTCAPLDEKQPSKKLINLFEELKEMDFKVIIFSNSSKKRIYPFKQQLTVDCSARSTKPLKYKLLKIIKKFNYDLSEVAIIGDHIMADVLCGNRVGIMTILVNPLSRNDKLTSKIVRNIEEIIINKMHKKGFFTIGKYYE